MNKEIILARGKVDLIIEKFSSSLNKANPNRIGLNLLLTDKQVMQLVGKTITIKAVIEDE